MSHQFLNSNKFATLDELKYLLLEILDRKTPVNREELSRRCKEYSFNFAFAFENTLAFLELVSIIKVQGDKSVTRVPAENSEQLDTDESLAAFILKKAIYFLDLQDIRKKIFSPDVLVSDPSSGTILQLERIPAEYPFIKSLLLNLRVGRPLKSSSHELVLQPVFSKLLQSRPEISPDKATQHKKPTFFISYSHKDEEFKTELQNHFSGLVSQGIIESWDGRAIMPGEDWDEVVRQKLELAEFVLFLVSADFMASEYINDVEIKRAIERHRAGEVRIIPIILRSCDFRSLPIGRFQALPTGAKAISSWQDKDAAYLDVVSHIRKILVKTT